MEKLSIENIHKILLNILSEFVNYIEINNISYVLCGGTLLGAIRHKGFIPWDDDIDIHILRSEYERLISIAKECDKFGNDDEFEIFYPGKNGYIFPYIKVCDKRYEAQEKYMNNCFDGYLYIDVFPLDYLPKDVNKRKNFVYRSNKLRHILLSKIYKRENTNSSFFYWLFKCSILFILGGEKNVALMIDSYGKKCNNLNKDSHILGNGSWPNDVNDYIDDTSLTNKVVVEFEGKSFLAPSDYDGYLKRRYGDYMTLPPVEKRVSHSLIAYKVIDNNYEGI